MNLELLTTGQAAKLYSVTPDTVLKWIRSGRLTAQRTVGGHHRIRLADLDQMRANHRKKFTVVSNSEYLKRISYCWEYNGNGKLLDECKQCAVYKMRAQRCYEVVEHAEVVGHSKVFCKGTCLECDYYRLVHRQAANVLTITDNDILTAYLRIGAEDTSFNLEFVNCEYACSAVVDRFRPDYAIIDCSLGPETVKDVVTHLIEDPRIPHIRVILAVEPGELPHECNKEIFARIEKPFNAHDLFACVAMTGRDSDEKVI